MAVGAIIAAALPVVGNILGFVPNKNNRPVTYLTNSQKIAAERKAELEKEETRAKQTTAIIYASIGIIVMIVVVRFILKKTKSKSK